ncbi:MAG: hypothetical protein COV70_03020 [Parcubacteria group bacterium CG11_big_fil_rev_8_21_14_0_20_39_22]|nr:MAG: hypothetical protein COV70_03020 [Parcubacteria group bacterium CG11_big_fil_rev_8_21_14_0_20_39_22]
MLPHNGNVSIKEGKLVDRIKNLKQRDWIKACERLGLHVLTSHGKGSHCAVYKNNTCPPGDSSCCVVTIPHNLYSQIQRDIFKKILSYGLKEQKYSEEDIWIALKIKKKRAI